MLIIPAIDLKDGQVVRYTKGLINKTVYSDDPVSMALNWQKEGAQYLHVVDLDGALFGRQKNAKLVEQIIKTLDIAVEIGGGIRDLFTIKKMMMFGARRVVLGSRAIEDRGFLKKAIAHFGNRIVLALDASGVRIGLHGWKESVKIDVARLLKQLKRMRLQTIVHTNINRDGTLDGIDSEPVEKLLRSTTIDVIVSGGVSSLEDIRKLARLEFPNLKGVIVGKALYEKRFALKEAIAVSSLSKELI
jgi:phosphoribosylformimino-5-aminoimidazole carboxamide ribotide isomerase